MDKDYHSCGHVDGSHFLVKKGKKCLAATANCFWRDPHDVINTVKIRSETEKPKVIRWKSMMDYFNKKREKQNSI